MTLTVRLTPDLEQQLERYCKKHRVSKSRVVSDLLSKHLARDAGAQRTPYEILREFNVIGAFASGKGDLAENRKRYLVEELRAKHSR